RHGSSLDRVVRCVVMLADIKDWPAMNKVYTTFFTKNLPARSALGASGLVFKARVEIECTATVGYLRCSRPEHSGVAHALDVRPRDRCPAAAADLTLPAAAGNAPTARALLADL